MLDAHERLGEDICCHVLHTDQLQVNRPISNALPNEVVPHVNVLCHTMIHWVPCEEIGCTIVNVEGGWPWYPFLQFCQ